MRDTWIRIVRTPSTGQPATRVVKRVEVIRDGQVFANLPMQDITIQLPVSGPAYLTMVTPFFEEVIEEAEDGVNFVMLWDKLLTLTHSPDEAVRIFNETNGTTYHGWDEMARTATWNQLMAAIKRATP